MVSNTDMTIPTATGIGPGNGTLVELVARFAGREPEVAGKPKPPLFEETLTRVGGNHPLVVGDRLDTDIEGAVTMGWDSLLVLTGVTGLEELVRAAEASVRRTSRRDLDALAEPQTSPEMTDDGVRSAAGPRASTTVGFASRATDSRRLVARRRRRGLAASRRDRTACRDRRRRGSRVACPP